MKRLILCLLALMLILASFSAALAEDLESLQQALEALAGGSGEEISLESILTALPEAASPGAVVSRSWEGADGASYTFVYYAGVPSSVPSDQLPEDDVLTNRELLDVIDWVETQLRTEAADGVGTVQAADPAVYQTALPMQLPAPDPAVYSTAQPAPMPTLDPAVFYTAQPMPTPTARPYIRVTACPTVRPRGAYPVWNAPRPTQAPAATPQPAVRATSAPTVSTGDYTTFDSTMQEQKLLNLLNQDRAQNGLPPLTLDPELSRLAQLKSNDMNANHYFAHESPTYGNAGQMLTAFNYDYQGVGENIAHHANVEKAEAAFMSSDGHRRNILGSQWDKVGIGVSYDANGNVYVTQLFAR